MSEDDAGQVPPEREHDERNEESGSVGLDEITDRDAEGTGRARGRRRWKTISCWILVVLACLLAVLSVLVVWTRDELLDTDTFVATVTPLAQNPAIQSAVAAKISNELVSQTNLQQRVKGALPPKAGFLAEPLAAQVKSVTNQLTLKLVQGPAFQKLWAESIRRSHEQLDALLTGQQEGSITSSNGEVTVDLAQVQARIKKQLDARGITVFNKVPNARAPTLVLFRSTQLLKIQKLVKFLDKLAVFLPILTLLCFAGAIVLSADRRKWVARSAGGLALTMAVLLIAANVTRNQFLGSLLPSQPKDAAAAVIDTVSAKLLDGIRRHPDRGRSGHPDRGDRRQLVVPPVGRPPAEAWMDDRWSGAWVRLRPPQGDPVGGARLGSPRARGLGQADRPGCDHRDAGHPGPRRPGRTVRRHGARPGRPTGTGCGSRTDPGPFGERRPGVSRATLVSEPDPMGQPTPQQR